MQWQYMHISSALNAKNLILVGAKAVLKEWIAWRGIIRKILIQLNQFVLSVVQSQQKIAIYMENNSFHINVNFVVILHNGFVGAVLIFVTNAIFDKQKGNI